MRLGRATLRQTKRKLMGAAAAALLQDDGVVRALYEAQQPSDVLRAVDSRLRAVRVLPRTTRPTKKSFSPRVAVGGSPYLYNDSVFIYSSWYRAFKNYT